MKTLIVYSSKYGCVKDCAEYLKSKIGEDTKICDVNNLTGIEIKQFDNIIIGSSVYVGKISKQIKMFVQNNIDILLEKRVAIFLCCALEAQLNEYLNSTFPKSLLDLAISIKVFGSEARIQEMSFLDKTIIKAVTKGDFSKFKISYEIMDDFSKEILNL